LSFKEQLEFDELPGRIQSLESRKGELESRIADPGFYHGSADFIRDGLQQLQQLTTDIDAAYARWAELEALRNAS
jgi:ATP-binding cassette subfamily F protein uup